MVKLIYFIELPEMALNPRKYLFLLFMGLLILLPFLLHMGTVGHETRATCIFCDIANGREPKSVIEFDNGEIVIFKDKYPASTHHYLAVPKQHIESIKSLTKQDIPLVNRMERALKDFCIAKGLNTTHDAVFGFHVPPFISIKHLHMHAILPKSNIKFFKSLFYISGTFWFKNPEDAREYLADK